MESIAKTCNILKEQSLLFRLAQTFAVQGCLCISLQVGQSLAIADFKEYPLYVVGEGRLASETNTFEIGTFIDQGIYQRVLQVEEAAKVYKLSPQMATEYMHQVNSFHEQFTCILQSIYKIELEISDKNCIQLIRLKEGKLLTEEHRISKFFYVLLEGSCNVKRAFRINDKKQEVSLDIYSFKNYYLLGEEALFSEGYASRTRCTSDCYFMKINVEKFSRQLSLNTYIQLRIQYKEKCDQSISTTLNEKPESKLNQVSPKDIVEYFERANHMNNHRLVREKQNSRSKHLLEKFCQKNQNTHPNYMNYFIESTQDKIRFELISKGFKKPDLNEKVSKSLSKDQLRKMLRRKVVRELKTKGRILNLQDFVNSKSGLKPKKPT